MQIFYTPDITKKAELPEDMRSNISNLKAMSFRNSEGNFIPFSDVAHIEYKNIPFSIEKTNGKYSGKIIANCSEQDIYRVKEELTKEVKRLKLPKGVTIEETESEIQTREAMSETTIAIAAAVLLIAGAIGLAVYYISNIEEKYEVTINS